MNGKGQELHSSAGLPLLWDINEISACNTLTSWGCLMFAIFSFIPSLGLIPDIFM